MERLHDGQRLGGALGDREGHEIAEAFAHVVALHPPRRAIVGLEFYMFSADKPTEIRYIQGAARVPAGFDRVKRIDFSKPGQIGDSSSTKMRSQ